jgi:small nuclear ribonucleoprotein (snRNP)-like protein
MTLLVVVPVVVLVVVDLVALGLAGWWLVLRRPESVLDRRRRKQWVVTLKSGEAFRGVLTDHDASCVVLSDAEHYSDPQTPVPVDGEVVVLLSDIKYAQRP